MARGLCASSASLLAVIQVARSIAACASWNFTKFRRFKISSGGISIFKIKPL